MSMTKRNSGMIRFIPLLAVFLLCIGLLKTNVYGETNPSVIMINGNGTQTHQLSVDLKGKTTSIKLNNNTNYTMKVNLVFQDVKGWTTIKNNGEDSYMIPPQDSRTVELKFRSDFPGGTVTVTAEANDLNDVGGVTFENAFLPQNQIDLTGTVSGYVYSSFYYNNHPWLNPGERFFSFETANSRLVNLKLNLLNHVPLSLYLYEGSDSGMKNPIWKGHATSTGTGTESPLILDPGKYVLKVVNTASTSEEGKYTLSISGRDYIRATGIKFTSSEKSLVFKSSDLKKPKKITFTVSTIPENSDDKLVGRGGANKATFTWTLDNYGSSYSTYSKIFTEETTNGLSKSLEIVCTPDKPKVEGVTVSYNNIFIKKVYSGYYSASTKIYMKNGSKWVYKGKQGSNITIKNLKPSTSYTLRFLTEYKSDSGKVYKSYLDKTYKTPPKTKISVKSVSATAVKTTYVPKKVWPGYWNSNGQWINSISTGGYYTTTYKVTVKLNKPVSGALGLTMQGKKVSGTGTTFTFTFSDQGKLKGKKISRYIYPYYYKGTLIGYGPATKITTTIK